MLAVADIATATAELSLSSAVLQVSAIATEPKVRSSRRPNGTACRPSALPRTAFHGPGGLMAYCEAGR